MKRTVRKKIRVKKCPKMSHILTKGDYACIGINHKALLIICFMCRVMISALKTKRDLNSYVFGDLLLLY